MEKEAEMDHSLVANSENTCDPKLLFDAVKNADLKMVENLLKSGFDVNCIEISQFECDFTSLHLAVEYDDIEMISLLLSYGANVNAKASNNWTPLHNGAQKYNKSSAELLLNHGACINSFALEEGYTPLHIASTMGNFAVVELFLNKGADINVASTKNNLTPLHCATRSENQAIVSLLLQHGAQVDKQDKNGKTVLNYAVDSPNLMIIEDILKHGPDTDNSSNRSSFETAMKSCDAKFTPIVDALLHYGFHVTSEDAKNQMLFHGAITKGYLQTVEYLLQHGADVNLLYNKNDFNSFASLINSSTFTEEMKLKMTMAHATNCDVNSLTPLHSAVKNKQEKIARLLIKYKADVNCEYKNTKVPIYYAIEDNDLIMTNLLLNSGANVRDNNELLPLAGEKGNIDCVESLLKWNADINSFDQNGMTALHFTATRNDVAIAKMLLSKGANIDAQNMEGKTSLHYAVENGYMELIDILVEHKANFHCLARDGSTILHFSAGCGNEEITKIALDRGVDVNAKEMDGTTALHCAVQSGHKEIVKLLLENGAQVDSKKMIDDLTAVHMAAERGYQKIVEILLKFGADIDSKDENGETALHIASLNGRIKVAEILVEFGSDINIMNKDNITPLDRAMDGLIALNRWEQFSGDGTYDDFEPEEDDDEWCISIYGLVSMKLKAVLKLLQRHIIKMKSENLFVNEKDILLMSTNDELKDYQHACEKEIACMRSETINDSKISYYNFLTKSPNLLAKYLRNVNIIEALTAGVYLTKFPIYSGMIKSQFEKGLKSKKLVEQSSAILRMAFRNMNELPLVCIEKIFSYLTEEDLRNLKDTCSHLKMDDKDVNYF